MDFSLADDQQAAVDLIRQILTDHGAPEVLREVESGSEWFHREAWQALASADLLGLCLPEAVGGGGYGFLEACLLLQEVGRTVMPIPLWATLTASLTIAEFGSADQQQARLAGVVDGSTILTVALDEVDADAREPYLRADADGDGWRLSGTKTAVPAVHLASHMLVTARDRDDGLHVFVVPTDAAGFAAERQDTFNHEPRFRLEFDGVAVGAGDELAGGRATVNWLVDRATVGLCAVASGVSDGGMRRTADYAKDRKQFDRPIGSFQAVGHRMADCFIDNEAIRLTMFQAATHLDRGERVDSQVAVAKYWAAYGGRRVGHADLHLHGGISIDLDYPIHRYFLWAKQLENTLGAATPQLATLGSIIASPSPS